MFGYQKAPAPDLEAGDGSSLLYPGMEESPNLRWALIKKIYVILSIQLAMTAAVAAFVVKVPAISEFFVSSNAGLGVYIGLLILPFIGQLPSSSPHPTPSLSRLIWKIRVLIDGAWFVSVRSDVPSALLPSEAPRQPNSALHLHHRHQLRRRHDVRLHQR
jgi:hypothetical protein